MRTCPVGTAEGCTYEVRYITSRHEIAEAVEWLSTKPMIGLDLETTGLNYAEDTIITAQLGALGPEPRAYVFDLRCVSWQDMKPVWDLVENRTTRKLGMNLGFEARFLGFKGLKLRHVADIQLTELILRAGLFSTKKSHETDEGLDRAGYGATSMAALAERYLSIKLNKDHDLRTSFGRSFPGALSVEQLSYAADDVILPFFIFRNQQDEIRERELGTILKIEFETLPVLAQAELRGFLVQRDPWLALWQEAMQERDDLEKSLDNRFRAMMGQGELFGDITYRPVDPKTRRPIKYGSPDQLRRLISEYCAHIGWKTEIVTTPERLAAVRKQYGMEWLAQRQRREPETTEADIPSWVLPDNILDLSDVQIDTLRLARLSGQLPKDLVSDLLAYAVASHRVSAFGKKFLEKNVGPDGRMHPTFHQALTSTGRISSVPNVQNIPSDPKYRKCFTPMAGYKFVILDYSQIEPRLSAQVSQDPVYVRTFKSGLDIYLQVAEAMLGHPVDRSTTEGEVQRAIFKAVVLALAYRMGYYKLWQTMMLALEDQILDGTIIAPTREQVRDLHKRFFEVHTGIATYQDKMGAQADPETGPKIYDRYLDAPVTWVTAPCGRKRYFAPDAKSTYTEGPNAPIQGCVSGDTRIFERHRGYVTIESLVGQQIEVWDGETFATASVIASGKKTMLTICLRGGHEIQCSPDHRFLVVTDPARSTTAWVRAENLKSCHRIVLTGQVPDWQVPYTYPDVAGTTAHNASNSRLEALLSQFPEQGGELLGRIASDGSVTDKQVHAFVAHHEVEILPQLQATMEYWGHLTLGNPTRPNKLPFHRLTLSATGVAQDLQAQGIKQQIPTVAWSDSRILRGYLRGMFDGDGTVSPDGAVLVFGQGDKHHKWALEIQQALLLFGIEGRVRTYPPPRNGTSDNGRTVVQIRKRDMPQFTREIGFLNSKKHAKCLAVTPCRSRGKLYGLALLVTSIHRHEHPVEMFDVLNSSTDKFMANGFVTHNCSATITKLAAALVQQEIDKQGLDAVAVNLVHDEIVWEVREDQAVAFALMAKRLMEEAASRFIPDIPVIAAYPEGTNGVVDAWIKKAKAA